MTRQNVGHPRQKGLRVLKGMKPFQELKKKKQKKEKLPSAPTQTRERVGMFRLCPLSISPIPSHDQTVKHNTFA